MDRFLTQTPCIFFIIIIHYLKSCVVISGQRSSRHVLADLQGGWYRQKQADRHSYILPRCGTHLHQEAEALLTLVARR